jgi:hypothetical protein
LTSTIAGHTIAEKGRDKRNNKCDWVGTADVPWVTQGSVFCMVRVSRIVLCMDLRDKDIQGFRELWKKEFHEEISISDARRAASDLLSLYRILMRPLPNHPITNKPCAISSTAGNQAKMKTDRSSV